MSDIFIFYILNLFLLFCFDAVSSFVINPLLQINNCKLTNIYVYKYFMCCVVLLRDSPLTLVNHPIPKPSPPYINHSQIPLNFNPSLIHQHKFVFTQSNFYTFIFPTYYLTAVNLSKTLKLDLLANNG